MTGLKILLGLSGLTAISAAVLFFETILVDLQHYLILLTGILLLHTLWTSSHAHCLSQRSLALILGLSLLGTLFLTTREPPMFKVITEEPRLALAAKNLSLQRWAAVADQGMIQNHELIIKQPYLDKHPLVFPSLLATLHDITGHNPDNVFRLNIALTFILLALVAYLGLQLHGLSGAVGVIALLINVPLLAQQATSGSLEILHLLLLAEVLAAAQRYLTQPDTPRLTLLLLSGALLAQVRTESALLLLPVALIAYWGWWQHRNLRLNLSLALLPLLLLPVAVHLLWVRQWPSGLNWGNALSINLFTALEYYLKLDLLASMNAALGWLILLGLLAFSYICLRSLFQGKRPDALRGVILLLTPFVLVNLLFWLSQPEGNLQDPAYSQLSLPLTLLAILATIALLHLISWARKPLAIYLAISFYFITLPATSNHYYTAALEDAHYLAWAKNYFAQRPSTERYLIIAKKNALFLVNNQPSIIQNIAILRATQVQNLLKQGLLDRVYVLQPQYFDATTQRYQVAPGHELGKQYALEPLARYRFSLLEVAQISKVTAINPDPTDRPAHYPGFVEEARTGKLPALPITQEQVLEQIRRLP